MLVQSTKDTGVSYDIPLDQDFHWAVVQFHQVLEHSSCICGAIEQDTSLLPQRVQMLQALSIVMTHHNNYYRAFCAKGFSAIKKIPVQYAIKHGLGWVWGIGCYFPRLAATPQDWQLWGHSHQSQPCPAVPAQPPQRIT